MRKTPAHSPESTASRVCVFVLGMHRSGTSALTRVLNLLGATLPQNLMAPNRGNEAGFWEPLRLVELHDRLLAEVGSRWDDWRRLDTDALHEQLAGGYRQQLFDLIDSEYEGSPLFVLKDPRVCRFLPIYEELLRDRGIESRYVVVNRNPLAVVASLRRRDSMNETFASLLWLRHQLDAEMFTRERPRALISYEALLDDWRRCAHLMSSRLELSWPNPLGSVASAIEESLIRDPDRPQPTAADVERSSLPAWVRDAYVALTTLEHTQGDLVEEARTAASAALDRLRESFDEESDLFGQATFPEFEMREARAAAALVQRDAELSADLAAARRETGEEIHALQTDLADRELWIGDLKRQLDSLEGQLATRNEAYAELEDELSTQQEAWQAQYDALMERGDRMLRSTSWRLTAPLRALGRLLGHSSEP